MMHDQKTYEAFIRRMEKKLVLALKEDERLRKVARSVLDGVKHHTVDTTSGKVTGRLVPPHLKKASDEAWDAVTKHELHVVNSIKSDIGNARRAIFIVQYAEQQIGEMKFKHKIK